MAAEDLLRCHGPAKVNVVDVARAAGMSHTNVYKHFRSKAALHEAVGERWLATISQPLSALASSNQPCCAKLEMWLLALMQAKYRKIKADPGLFSTYHALVEGNGVVVAHHVEELRRQITIVLREGVAKGLYRLKDIDKAATAVLSATATFHHPHHIRAGEVAPVEEAKRVVALLNAGLAQGVL